MRHILILIALSLFIQPLHAKLKSGPAPDLGSNSSYNTADKGAVNLSKYRGQVVLIDFWATWCGPCVAAMPHLVELHNKYHKKGLTIIAHTDKSSRNVEGFIEKHKLPFIVSVGKDIGKAYGVTGIPAAFLLDVKGNIVWSGHSAGVRDSHVESALKDVTPAGLMAAKGYPFFETKSESTKVKAIQKSLEKGKIGASLGKLEKLIESSKDETEKTDAESTLKTVQLWIEGKEKNALGEIDSGDVISGYKSLSEFSKNLSGSEKQKAIKAKMTEVKKSEEYKIGLKFMKLEAALAKAKKDVRQTQYGKFAQKYPDSFYGKRAESLSRN